MASKKSVKVGDIVILRVNFNPHPRHWGLVLCTYKHSRGPGTGEWSKVLTKYGQIDDWYVPQLVVLSSIERALSNHRAASENQSQECYIES